jgi:hypothetical protein
MARPNRDRLARTPLYRFQNVADAEEQPQLETDEPNVYGEVVFKLGEVRHRFDGQVHSVWDGARCVLTKRCKRNCEH